MIDPSWRENEEDALVYLILGLPGAGIEEAKVHYV
jgi:hypothetical protein